MADDSQRASKRQTKQFWFGRKPKTDQPSTDLNAELNVVNSKDNNRITDDPKKDIEMKRLRIKEQSKALDYYKMGADVVGKGTYGQEKDLSSQGPAPDAVLKPKEEPKKEFSGVLPTISKAIKAAGDKAAELNTQSKAMTKGGEIPMPKAKPPANLPVPKAKPVATQPITKPTRRVQSTMTKYSPNSGATTRIPVVPVLQPLRANESVSKYSDYLTNHKNSSFNTAQIDELSPEYMIELYNANNEIVKKKKFKSITECEKFFLKNREVIERYDLQVKLYENKQLVENMAEIEASMEKLRKAADAARFTGTTAASTPAPVRTPSAKVEKDPIATSDVMSMPGAPTTTQPSPQRSLVGKGIDAAKSIAAKAVNTYTPAIKAAAVKTNVSPSVQAAVTTPKPVSAPKPATSTPRPAPAPAAAPRTFSTPIPTSSTPVGAEGEARLSPAQMSAMNTRGAEAAKTFRPK